MNYIFLLYLNIKANLSKIETQIKNSYHIEIKQNKTQRKTIPLKKKQTKNYVYIEPKKDNGPSSICNLNNSPEYCGQNNFNDTRLTEEP